jgi:hypothetical protein
MLGFAMCNILGRTISPHFSHLLARLKIKFIQFFFMFECELKLGCKKSQESVQHFVSSKLLLNPNGVIFCGM